MTRFLARMAPSEGSIVLSPKHPHTHLRLSVVLGLSSVLSSVAKPSGTPPAGRSTQRHLRNCMWPQVREIRGSSMDAERRLLFYFFHRRKCCARNHGSGLLVGGNRPSFSRRCPPSPARDSSNYARVCYLLSRCWRDQFASIHQPRRSRNTDRCTRKECQQCAAASSCSCHTPSTPGPSVPHGKGVQLQFRLFGASGNCIAVSPVSPFPNRKNMPQSQASVRVHGFLGLHFCIRGE